MTTKSKLADFEHPLVQETARILTQNEPTLRGKVEKLFDYVRDEIKFGFPLNGDLVTASETIRTGTAQCNTKGTLFLALCKALGIPARLHFSTIKKEIQRGLFTGWAYRLMPRRISHSWLEVQLEGRWRRIDSYINDIEFYESARVALGKRGWDTGFSIACGDGESNVELALDDEQFVQMSAVVDDHGVWDEPMDYYSSPTYKNRPGLPRLLLYRLLVGRINRRVQLLRERIDPDDV